MSPCLKPNLIWFVLSTNFSSYYQLHTEVIMKAAVVSSFGAAPRYEEFPSPTAAGDDGTVIDVIADGLHPASGRKPTGRITPAPANCRSCQASTVSGAARTGCCATSSSRTPRWARWLQTVIDPRRSIVLPEDSDPIAVAAAMNPAMSSWVALHQRVPFQAGQNVLVLGATGNAGRMAVQIARLLGADQVIAAGRGAGRPGLGATGTVLLEGDAGTVAQRLGQVATDVDVVIDYLWGPPATAAMVALVTDRGKPITWIQIVGSGQGSVSTRENPRRTPPPSPKTSPTKNE